jgi:DNA polymerase-3 subunit chi
VTRVSFYILQNPDADWQDFACRLLERIYAQGQRAYVHLPSPQAQAALDERLWTFKPESFIPHELESQDNTCVIVLGSGGALPAQRDVFLNLDFAAERPPEFFSSFERCLEIVAGSAQDKSAARARYGFYRDRGYALENHTIS